MKIKNIIMNLMIGVLCLFLVIFLGVFVQQIFDYNRSYNYDENSFLYTIQEQDYSRLVDMMYRNEAAGAEVNETYEECYAVARYFEAATYYKAYMEDGNLELASQKKKIMQEQVLLMGDLSYTAMDIDAKLGLEQKK